MKYMLTALTCFLLMNTVSAQGSAPSADLVLKSVYAKASKENKKVLLMFHASWCGWCHKMDTSLQDKTVKPLIDRNFVTTHLTVYEQENKKYLDNPGALELLKKYNGAEKGIPSWLILDSEGDELATSIDEQGENSGCPASENEVAYFIRVLKKTSDLKDVELKVIEKRFRMNELKAEAVKVSK